MTANALKDIEQVEASLWEAADQLRANSKLTSSEYVMPVLGIIFLRHAFNRYEAARSAIEADQAAGRMPKRPLVKADFLKRRAMLLPPEARFDALLERTKDANLGAALVGAMKAIEAEFAPLAGQLPNDYEGFDPDLLEALLRIFDSEALRTASGDVFGRIYEYFLMKFAIQGAQDSGEFFTPPSLVQTIVNVIEPDHGIVFDPACGSGGMFVQSSHFIESRGKDTSHRVTFYGQEKTGTTIRLAKMNLAVHGLEGDIREANTFYEDVHHLKEGRPIWGNCDFVMANPPFNVDMVNANVAGDRRLPFGLPGTTKNKQTKKETVSNGNYLWISYFWSYLNATGRAGFVMSSQASSAGHGEALVRRKLVETGDVDVMIAIRSNFFYTRTVPCELWHLDRGKPEERRDQVLMIDARNLYRKVTRKIYDFSPEQLANLTAIVWLYRGQRQRFLDLVAGYVEHIRDEIALIEEAVLAFEERLVEIEDGLKTFSDGVGALADIEVAQKQPLADALADLAETESAYERDRASLMDALATFAELTAKTPPASNADQHATRHAFAPLAERIKGLVKQIDLLYKIAARAAQLAQDLASDEPVGANLFAQNSRIDDGANKFAPTMMPCDIQTEPIDPGREAAKLTARIQKSPVGANSFARDAKALSRRIKPLDADRKTAVEQLKLAVYFHRQILWLQERFPEAEFIAVPGLCKALTRAEIEAADWSLTPGRYVGVAPPEEDEDFDFEQTLRDIHVELADLNREAAELAARIQANFDELL